MPYYEPIENIENLEFKTVTQRKLEEMQANGITPPKWLIMEASYKQGVIENLEFKRL